VPLSSFAADDRSIDKEIHSLVRRLARHGLVDYRLGRPRDGEDLVVSMTNDQSRSRSFRAFSTARHLSFPK
jgi:hypothetical protein